MTFDEWYRMAFPVTVVHGDIGHAFRQLDQQEVARAAWDAASAKWVPISERLPEDEQRVLVIAPSWRESVQFGQWFRDIGEWRVAGCNNAEQVIAWQPIPKSRQP
jgi:hypothetical protein